MKLLTIILSLVFSSIVLASDLTNNSYKGVVIGASASNALDLLDGYVSNKWEYDKGWRCYLLHHRSNRQLPVFMILGENKVARVSFISKDGPKTIQGVGVGSSKAEVLSKYKKVDIKQHHYIKGGEYIEVKLNNGIGLKFETTDNVVIRFHLGSIPAIRAIEGCV